uniref:helix-turn-helix domain-containing protein n=1 Tax=Candidatus Thiodubiliella endoseptemdiera TaxID=2738886 RepID=UPI0034DDFCC1
MSVNEFKNRLNAFLIDSEMSQNTLAESIGISQSQVSNLANVGVKMWAKNTKKINDFIKNYYQNNFKIPIKIEGILKQIFI